MRPAFGAAIKNLIFFHADSMPLGQASFLGILAKSAKYGGRIDLTIQHIGVYTP
jgi:hypothetical protein